jgi:hypothetical protein
MPIFLQVVVAGQAVRTYFPSWQIANLPSTQSTAPDVQLKSEVDGFEELLLDEEDVSEVSDVATDVSTEISDIVL